MFGWVMIELMFWLISMMLFFVLKYSVIEHRIHTNPNISLYGEYNFSVKDNDFY